MDLSVETLEKARVGEVFRSRKNRVFMVVLGGETLVAKVFPPGSEERAFHEHSILQACLKRGVRVPRPMNLEGRALLTEYLEGRTAAQAVDSLQAGADEVLCDLVEWLSSFHRAHSMKLCRGDCVLHNFLVTSEGVVGIDFEEAHEGDPVEDVGQMIAGYLSMRPAFKERKFAVTQRAVSQYNASSGCDRNEDVPRAVSSALRHYGRFREDGDLLRAWADRIEREGLVLRE